MPASCDELVLNSLILGFLDSLHQKQSSQIDRSSPSFCSHRDARYHRSTTHKRNIPHDTVSPTNCSHGTVSSQCPSFPPRSGIVLTCRAPPLQMLTASLGNSLVIFVVMAFVAALCIATYIGVPRIFPRETQLYVLLLLLLRRSPIYLHPAHSSIPLPTHTPCPSMVN